MKDSVITQLNRMGISVFASLEIQYKTLEFSREASRDFDNLFMKGKPFQNFIAQFSTLAQKSGKTERQKVEALKPNRSF